MKKKNAETRRKMFCQSREAQFCEVGAKSFILLVMLVYVGAFVVALVLHLQSLCCCLYVCLYVVEKVADFWTFGGGGGGELQKMFFWRSTHSVHFSFPGGLTFSGPLWGGGGTPVYEKCFVFVADLQKTFSGSYPLLYPRSRKCSGGKGPEILLEVPPSPSKNTTHSKHLLVMTLNMAWFSKRSFLVVQDLLAGILALQVITNLVRAWKMPVAAVALLIGS